LPSDTFLSEWQGHGVTDTPLVWVLRKGAFVKLSTNLLQEAHSPNGDFSAPKNWVAKKL
jgi:hypothetical protein